MENSQDFSKFNISPELLKAIRDIGFEEPTPIQELAIPRILAGSDVTGQAQTGTGKTAAFAIPAFEILNPKSRDTQVLVLSPTRELAIQTAEEFTRLSKYMDNVVILPIYGGQPIDRQLRILQKQVHIIVGTPGRILDHMNRGSIDLSGIAMVILDEADQMLDMGFREDIETILAETPDSRQTIMFSATIPKPIQEISARFQHNAEFIKVIHKEMTVPQVEQQYLEVRSRDKFEVLCRFLDMDDPELAMIFCNTKMEVDELTSHLQTRGYFAEALHGDLKQMQRDRVMAKFRAGTIDLLVATDVAARGIDVDDVDLVINYDVPQDVEYYVHRIGRTARAGRNGRAITFVGPKDIYKLKSIQRFAKIRITQIPLPTPADVEEMKVTNLIGTIKKSIDEGDIDKYIEIVELIMVDNYSSLDIAAALLKREMGTKKAEDTVVPPDFGSRRDDYQNSSYQTGSYQKSEPGMCCLHMNFGKEQKLRPKDIVGAISGETGIPGKLIGAIRIFRTYSLVDVPREHADMIIQKMQGKSIGSVKLMKGKTIRLYTPEGPARKSNNRY